MLKIEVVVCVESAGVWINLIKIIIVSTICQLLQLVAQSSSCF